MLDDFAGDRSERQPALLGRNGVGKSTLPSPSWDYARRPRSIEWQGRTSPRSRPICAPAQGSAGWRRSAKFCQSLRGRKPHRRTVPDAESGAIFSCFRASPSGAQMGKPASGGEQQMPAIARALMTNWICCCSMSRLRARPHHRRGTHCRHRTHDEGTGHGAYFGRAAR